MRKNSSDYIPLLVANRILGGEPESRLGYKIREDKGYAYYASQILELINTLIQFLMLYKFPREITDSSVINC